MVFSYASKTWTDTLFCIGFIKIIGTNDFSISINFQPKQFFIYVPLLSIFIKIFCLSYEIKKNTTFTALIHVFIYVFFCCCEVFFIQDFSLSPVEFYSYRTRGSVRWHLVFWLYHPIKNFTLTFVETRRLLSYFTYESCIFNVKMVPCIKF